MHDRATKLKGLSESGKIAKKTLCRYNKLVWHRIHNRGDSAEKYKEAIEKLKKEIEAPLPPKEGEFATPSFGGRGASVESVAKEFGFVPEVFRAYLKRHEPELFEQMGKIVLPNGKKVLRRSYEKYAEAVEYIRAAGCPITEASKKFGFDSRSLGGFIRRNFPELMGNLKIKR